MVTPIGGFLRRLAIAWLLWDVFPVSQGGEHALIRSAFAKKIAGPIAKGTLSQSVRPHIWYFVLSDCRHTLANFTHRLKFEFHAKQADGSEFSIEMTLRLPSVQTL
eukprot:g7083.t1